MYNREHTCTNPYVHMQIYRDTERERGRHTHACLHVNCRRASKYATLYVMPCIVSQVVWSIAGYASRVGSTFVYYKYVNTYLYTYTYICNIVLKVAKCANFLTDSGDGSARLAVILHTIHHHTCRFDYVWQSSSVATLILGRTDKLDGRSNRQTDIQSNKQVSNA